MAAAQGILSGDALRRSAPMLPDDADDSFAGLFRQCRPGGEDLRQSGVDRARIRGECSARCSAVLKMLVFAVFFGIVRSLSGILPYFTQRPPSTIAAQFSGFLRD